MRAGPVSDLTPRTPLACGALGRYRPEAVARIAGRLDAPVSEVHRDRRSCLWLDREPVRWGRRRAGGLLWSELPDANARERASGWEDAATRLASCGLELRGRERTVHSSVSGIAPVYWIEHEGATYFASRIDPLVQALEPRLTVDWSAWASIFCLGNPLEDETPFREVRLLVPFSRLSHSAQGARVERPPWPWAQVSSELTVEEGAGPMLDALRAVVAPLAPLPAVSLLSGGLDSRLALALLVEAGAGDVRAVTMGGEAVSPDEAEYAAAVARHYGIPLEVVDYRDARQYLDVLRTQFLLLDYQRPRMPWIAALARDLTRFGRLAWDGLALDSLSLHRDLVYVPEMFAPTEPRDRARLAWRRLNHFATRRANEALFDPVLGRALANASRRRFVAASEPYFDHPSQTILTHYRSRTLRATSTVPHQLIGSYSAITTPFTDDAFARASVAIDPLEKFELRSYEALYAGVDPAARALPTTADPRPNPRRARVEMQRAPEVVAHLESLLRAGPLAERLSGEVRSRLVAGTLGESFAAQRPYRQVLVAAMFAEWVGRYGSHLRGLDPGEGLDLARAARAVEGRSGSA